MKQHRDILPTMIYKNLNRLESGFLVAQTNAQNRRNIPIKKI